ncbi:hypothetical protein GQ43DRAFT_248251 [Delitschia confertaspora ATCC 74209]|uniref:Uncharacterized protein n=1 Tax=Delitschia confertaspora ATCC 74209 TaxID=1513339 RepID=A0A9P4JHJ7_9PLEO|nr:hypothetical protein GQ43DRAFT_248251 [Delitschia confertaspora ATCC 74209]
MFIFVFKLLLPFQNQKLENDIIYIFAKIVLMVRILLLLLRKLLSIRPLTYIIHTVNT